MLRLRTGWGLFSQIYGAAWLKRGDRGALASVAAGNLVIGLQKNSSLLPAFNAAMQSFTEDGTLSSLRRTWFDGLSQCGGGGDLNSGRLGVSEMLGELA